MKKTILYLVFSLFFFSCEDNDSLIALFEFTPKQPKLNESVVCNNLSTNAISYSWYVEFKSVDWSPNQSPKTINSDAKHLKFNCNEYGTYTVKLQVWDESKKQTDSYTKILTVN